MAAAATLLVLLPPLAVVAALYARAVLHRLLYACFRLLFGTLYPAYASYKAVRTKNVKEYVKWMMYWIVFAIFSSIETFTDVFLSFWFPFYYEIKIALLLWLLSPATKGSSILYRKFVHPMLSRREQDIDEYIAKAKEQGYHTVLNLGTKGVNYATTVIMQTAIKTVSSQSLLPLGLTPGTPRPRTSSEPAEGELGLRSAQKRRSRSVDVPDADLQLTDAGSTFSEDDLFVPPGAESLKAAPVTRRGRRPRKAKTVKVEPAYEDDD
ncbi:receptor expression-enhancing protein 1-like isoform X9 [Bacillus rossius redtenbacheri]|uniref:receptor expression-enhancing protein 1-like isoform X9 n=1 Tax=Bacillus rossius redtenbacheri TaxID=93214 RepID=UPI002FDEB263